MKLYYIGYELNGVKHPLCTHLGFPFLGGIDESYNGLLNVYWDKKILLKDYDRCVKLSKGFTWQELLDIDSYGKSFGTTWSKEFLGGRVFISRLNSKNAEFKVDIKELLDYYNKYINTGFRVRAQIIA